MIEHDVPPHITISAIETKHEDAVVNSLNHLMTELPKTKMEWVTVGAFPTVIYIQPVLNEGLHHLSSDIYECVKDISDTKISKFYQPFHWLPHVTIAKQLSEDEMKKAFEVLHKSFIVFEGEVVRIELAKKNPYRVIKTWQLNEK